MLVSYRLGVMGLLADTEGMSCYRWVLVLPAELVTWVVVGDLILGSPRSVNPTTGSAMTTL